MESMKRQSPRVTTTGITTTRRRTRRSMADTRRAVRGRCACGVSVESQLGQACNEEAFRYFLAMERNRSRRSGRPFLLVLVRLQQRRGTACLDAALAEKVFSCLWLSLRATDQVGWFREGRVVGALLADMSEQPVAGSVCQKVGRA